MLEPLMQQYQQGSLTAFEALYRELAPRVRGFLRAKVRDEARVSDLLQETFLEIHRSRRTYLPGASVAGWVFGIAKRSAAPSPRRATPRARDSGGSICARAPNRAARRGFRAAAAARCITRAVAGNPRHVVDEKHRRTFLRNHREPSWHRGGRRTAAMQPRVARVACRT